MFLVTLLLFLASISLHELGHALAMRRYGVPITEISLLGFGPKLFSFKMKKLFGETPLSIRLIPLGAFVAPEEASVDKLTYKQKVKVYVAGIVANFLFASFLLFVVGILVSNLKPVYWLIPSSVLLLAGIFRLLPASSLLIGFALFSLMAYDVITDPKKFQENNGSIVTIVAGIAKESKIDGRDETVWIPETNMRAIDYAKAITFGAVLSVAIAVMNMLPLIPFDGGRIAMETLLLGVRKRRRPRTKQVFIYSSIAISLCLVVSALWADGEKIVEFFLP